MAESTIGRFVERKQAVDAMHYLGNFPLEFLQDGEQVRHAGDGAAEVVEAPSPHTRLALVPLGYWLIRWPDRSLQTADPQAFAEDFEEAADRA